MKEIKASITIAASPIEVWQVLTDFDHYSDWNPMLTNVKGTFAKFSQGKKYTGWGTGFYTAAGSLEGARCGLVAMNNALAIETLRRKQLHLQQKQSPAEKATTFNEKTKDHNAGDDTADLAIVDLDISDAAAVAMLEQKSESDVGTDTTSYNNSNANTQHSTSPKPEKRTSLIGTLFGGGGGGGASKSQVPTSSSKDDLIARTISEEGEDGSDDDEDGEENEDGDEDVEDDDEFEIPEEDPEAKRLREAKNAERIELDLGGGGLSMAEFGL
ncbi:hypothetical protein BG004_001796 [Podila humilis]|nr:hypothetical protein BG004_001796 [Podila humilis]